LATFERRIALLSAAAMPRSESELAGDALRLLTSSERDRGDSAHLLVLDLHRALDALAATLATENVAGAQAYGLEASDIAARMPNAEQFLHVVERADDAADALEEAAFLTSLMPSPTASTATAFAELGDLVVSTAEAYLACVAAARGAAPEGQAGILEAFDAVLALEHRMDNAERHAVARFGRDGAIDGKLFVIASRITGAAEQAVDALTHASLALRDRVTGLR
jgi:hypothetical protein